MNTPQGSHEQQVQILNLQQGIADTENLTALANLQAARVDLQAARIDFQTEMMIHLNDAEANAWVQELHEDNQKAKAEREEKEAQKKQIWENLSKRFSEKTEQEESPKNKESIDISAEQPDQQSAEKTEEAEQPTDKTEQKNQ